MSKNVFSAVMFFFLLTSMSVLVFNIQPVKAQGTIYIRADGSIDPPTAPISTFDNVTYTLTGNITSDTEGIVVERNNTIVDGAWYTILGTSAYVRAGISLSGRSNVTIKNTRITKFYYGIDLNASSGNSISGNSITTNSWDGIRLNASSHNSICGNNITANGWDGVELGSSSDNSIAGNNITANYEDGINLWSSSNNSISGNKITNNSFGIYLEDSSNVSISGNNITNNWDGVELDYSSDNSISGNNIRDNSQFGIFLDISSNNKFYHNSFINNTYQVVLYSDSLANVWDDGYPSGGNYWSDYSGVDLSSGPYQNETGSDGIGDVPYTIDADNQDNYPLMKPYSWGPDDIGITSITPSKTVVGQGYSLGINVTAANQGSYQETFNVAVYANATVIGTQTVNNLLNGTSTVLTFAWNTTGVAYGNYTISSYAEPVPGETDTANNNYTCLIPVHVGVPGDVSSSTPGVYDGKVSMMDIAYLISLFNTKPSSPNWNANADVDNNGVVSMIDIAIAILNFNQHE